MRVAAAIAMCALGASVVHAQPSDPNQPAPSIEPAPLPQPPVAAPDTRNDAAWQLYHDAFAALLQGDKGRAQVLVAQLQRDFVGHPAAQLSLSRPLGDPMAPTPALPPPSDKGPVAEQPSKGARAELALFQTVHGIVLGVEVCLLVECDEAGAYFALALLGGAAGAGASLAQENLTSGQRAMLNSGTVWGAANAGLALIITQPDSDTATPYVLTMMAGQLGGLALGAGLQYLKPTSGQVGLTNSGGQWSLALTGLMLAALQPDMSEKGVGMTLLLAMDGGLALGAYLASRYPHVTRGQGWVIDAAGIAGGVGGAGLGILVGGSADERATPALAAAGAVVGLGVATYMTRNWGGSDNDSSVRTVILPVERGRGATAGIGFTW